MSTAVVILNAIARDEYERDWNGFDEPFSFIDGDGEERGPVTQFSAEVDGVTTMLAAREVASVATQQLQRLREEIDDEELEEEADQRPSFSYRTDEEKDDEARERQWQYWTDQLVTEAEYMAVWETRLHHLLEGWKALVADFTMIGDRIPALKPVLAERLQETYDAFVSMIQGVA